ncbi:3 beta-hydroxysteroid dehydrogenase type 7 isoform X2 [Denticeps clupeoides]|nr:3 beta-hydroxysteroid dehydrogenase type 7 isoform X2 [Denticeps clupeoides]XP_028841066.1 3 beta-hydroxysteroid dehydrogenase type 7 isoform X2 [Denticeps clupeoides]
MADTKQGLVYFMTGGCGFLGQHLLRVLLEKGEGIAEVRLFDKQIDSSLQDRTTDQVKVVVIQGDITDYSSVLEASRGADLIIHTASLVDVWYRVPEKVIYAVNVQGTQHIIDACVENSIQYLVYTSSMEVVGPNIRGDTFKRGNEDTKYNIYHEMPYPKSKAKAEKMVLQSNGIKVKAGGSLYTCALRPTGIYGEHHQLMKEFYQSGVKTGGWLICGVPKNTEHGRVYAGNVAWMHLIAAQSLRDHPEKLGGECYFCYDDSPYLSYEDFNMQFLSAFNFRKLHIPLWALWAMTYVVSFLHWALKPVYNFTPLLNHYTLAVACTSFTVSTDKAERHFNYQPLYSWEECRSRTQRWVDTFPLEITDSKNE